MKFTISRKLLLAAVAKSGLLAVKATTLPVVNHLLFDASKETGLLSVTGSDVDNQIVSVASADITDPGSLCLPFKKLFDWLDLVKADEIAFELDTTRCLITADTKAKFAFIKADEFPLLKSTPTQSFSLPAVELKDKIGRIRHAMGETVSSGSEVTDSIAFLFEPTLTIIAANGKRCAIEQINAEGKGTFIVPAEFVNRLSSLFSKDSDGNATVSLSSNFISISTDSWSATGKLKEGRYPVSRKAFDENYTFDQCIAVDRQLLLNRIRQCKLFVDNPNLSPMMKWECDGKSLSITGATGENEFFSDPIPCSGFEFRITLPPDNLIDALSVLTGELVTIDCKDHLYPIKLVENTFQSIIMPLRS